MQELVERKVFDISATLLAIQRKTVVTVMQHVETGIDTIVTATPVLGERGEVDKVISNVLDITELNKLKARVESIEVEKRA
ncbi:hypothetical protein R0K18_31865, partial [Pantoea sp. SIMBA_133]